MAAEAYTAQFTLETGEKYCVLNQFEPQVRQKFGCNCFDQLGSDDGIKPTATAPFGLDKRDDSKKVTLTVEFNTFTEEYETIQGWFEDAAAAVKVAFPAMSQDEIDKKKSEYGSVRFPEDREVAQIKLRIKPYTRVFWMSSAKTLTANYSVEKLPKRGMPIIAIVDMTEVWVTVAEDESLVSWGIHFAADQIIFQNLSLPKTAKTVDEYKRGLDAFGLDLGTITVENSTSTKRRKLNTGKAKKIIF